MEKICRALTVLFPHEVQLPYLQRVALQTSSIAACFACIRLRGQKSLRRSDAMTSTAPSDSSGGRQLPTRVSKACDRCRRNKSRCDSFRPCSLCVRASAECLTGSNEQPIRPPKRKRTRGPSSDEPLLRTPRVSVERPFQPSAVQQETEAVQREGQTSLGSTVEPRPELESRRPSVVDGEVDSTMSIAQKIYQLGGQGTPTLRRLTSAIPGGDVYSKQAASRLNRDQRRPISAIIGYPLPTVDLMRLLLEEYFDSVHWFSLVIYEPKFRPKFESIHDGLAYPSQKAFLLLLSVLVGMGAWYKSHKSGKDVNHPYEDWRAWASSLVQGAGSQLTDLMDQSSIASVQACILLGSYYVYHGKPNLSFALLGATIRTAQAIGLHRQPLRGDAASIEERKRVWWTIYTWDRFASVTYGRPLGINDKDCNVTHPIDTFESPYFSLERPDEDGNSICYSSYQRELNKLYMTASPIIETIFGMRAMSHSDPNASHQYVAKVMEATERLWAWRRRLPPNLLLDLSSDCEPNYSRTSKVHRLQALSLQLTFDNLLIIFHRPSLAQQVEHLIRNQPDHGQGAVDSPSSLTHATSTSSPFFAPSANSPLSNSQMSSTEQWWDAALRTSKVTQMPQLAQLATDSHLVAFLAINLFNSAIVMAVLALSDPLSDRAQEVKRSITRIFRLQELLGKKTELSMQSNVVLKDVIHMLLRRESEAMLAPVITSGEQPSGDGDVVHTTSEAPLLSVEDTLRLPIQLPTGTFNARPDYQHQSTLDKTLRLNESLASVQRVFPITADGLHIDNIAHETDYGQCHDVPNQMLEDSDNAWLESGLHSLTGEPVWTDDGNLDTSGNGLYWFWDFAWGDTRS